MTKSIACEHQKALSWGKGRNVTLTREFCTPVQLEVLDRQTAEAVRAERDARVDLILARAKEAQDKAGKGHISYSLARFLKDYGFPQATVFDAESITSLTKWTVSTLATKIDQLVDTATLAVRRILLKNLQAQAATVIPDRKFSSCTFIDSQLAPCPVCGHIYGTPYHDE
jgi:hypothetical protein